MLHIVITGALGHIGSYLIRDLHSKLPIGKYTLVDNLSSQRYNALFDFNPGVPVKFITENVQTIDWPTVLKDVDVVIHLAAITDATASINLREYTFNNNVAATKVLSSACSYANVPLLFPSSTSVYGSSAELVDETCNDLKPQSPYAEAKIYEEQLCHTAGAQIGLQYVICRLGTIFGFSPGIRFHTAVNKFCWQAILGQKITVWNTAYQQKRPYLALQDASTAIALIIKQKLFHGECYNILTANYTVQQVIQYIRDFIPELSIEFVDNAIMNQLSYEVSCHKLSQQGFIPTGDISNCIKETLYKLRACSTHNLKVTNNVCV